MHLSKTFASIAIVILVTLVLALLSGVISEDTMAGQAFKLNIGKVPGITANLEVPELGNNVRYSDSQFICNNGKKVIASKLSKIKLCNTEKEWQEFSITICKRFKGVNQKTFLVNKKVTCQIEVKEPNRAVVPAKNIVDVVVEENVAEEEPVEEVLSGSGVHRGVGFGEDVVAERIKEPQNSAPTREGMIDNYYSVNNINGLTFKLEKELYSDDVEVKKLVGGEWISLNVEKISEDEKFVYYILNG